MMTGEELQDLRTIAAAVRRIEAKVDAQGERIDRLERFADKAEGALTFIKWLSGFIGIGGAAVIIAALANGRL